MRVLVIAPSMALRFGLAAMLQSVGQQDAGQQTTVLQEIHVAGVAASIREAATLADQTDVVMLAAEGWPHGEVERLSALREVGGLVLLSDQPQQANRMLQAWGGENWGSLAWGLLRPDASLEELTAVLYAVHEGLVAGPARLLRQALAAPSQAASADPDTESFSELTGREREVLQRLAQGLANKQIGLALGISEHTVKFHVSAVYTKLGAANRTEAVRFGLQKGLISL